MKSMLCLPFRLPSPSVSYTVCRLLPERCAISEARFANPPEAIFRQHVANGIANTVSAHSNSPQITMLHFPTGTPFSLAITSSHCYSLHISHYYI